MNKTLFYILSCTWGILFTLAGAVVALVMTITGHRPKRWGWAWYFEAGKRPWGGMDWGPVFVKDRFSGDDLKTHEFGHSIQNCFFGPFMIFIVGIPSSARYWIRRINTRLGHAPKTAYEDIWFEAQATMLGQRIMKNNMHIDSTLCYIEKDGCFLMLFRNKKENDPCEGKWVGIGGKFEPGESADECLMREVREETGLILTSFTPCGVVHFRSDELPDEEMYLYTADGFEGILEADEKGNVLNSDEVCNEGDLRWVKKEEITKLNLWEGDIYFLEPLIKGETDIDMTCRYEGDRIAEVVDNRNGQIIL